MNIIRKKALIAIPVVMLLILSACGGYKYKAIPFKAPETYPNHKKIGGAIFAADIYSDPVAAKEAFGFDIRGAGLLPIQVIVDNKGPHPLKLIPDQIFLKDQDGNYWRILPARRAYERISDKIRLARMGSEAANTSVVAGAAGAVLGFALGVVTGTDVGTSTVRGAAAGAAYGAITGGARGYNRHTVRDRISRDLKDKGLKDKPFAAKELSHAFLFFPGEAKSPKTLRLKIREADTNKVHILDLTL